MDAGFKPGPVWFLDPVLTTHHVAFQKEKLFLGTRYSLSFL